MQRGVGQPCDHRNLDSGQDLPRIATLSLQPPLLFYSDRYEQVRRARATPENHQIKSFRLRLLKYLSG